MAIGIVPVHFDRGRTSADGMGEGELRFWPASAQIEELSKAFSGSSFSTGHVAGNFVLVEYVPDGRQEFRELFGELGIALRRVGEPDQLFANQNNRARSSRRSVA